MRKLDYLPVHKFKRCFKKIENLDILKEQVPSFVSILLGANLISEIGSRVLNFHERLYLSLCEKKDFHFATKQHTKNNRRTYICGLPKERLSALAHIA